MTRILSDGHPKREQGKYLPPMQIIKRTFHGVRRDSILHILFSYYTVHSAVSILEAVSMPAGTERAIDRAIDVRSLGSIGRRNIG